MLHAVQTASTQPHDVLVQKQSLQVPNQHDAVDSVVPGCWQYRSHGFGYDVILKKLASEPTLRHQRFFFCRHGETEPNRRRVLQGSGINESLNDGGTIFSEVFDVNR